MTAKNPNILNKTVDNLSKITSVSDIYILYRILIKKSLTKF